MSFLDTTYKYTEADISNAVENINNIFLETAKMSLKIRHGKCRSHRRRIPVNNKKWFDKECNLTRVQLRKISNRKHRNPENEDIRKEYHDSLKTFKRLLKKKREDFQNSKVDELLNCESNSQNFWQILKSANDNCDSKESDAASISPKEWVNHFEKLHSDVTDMSSEQNRVLQNFEMNETVMKDKSKCLDQPFTEKEMSETLKKLKNNKSAGDDRIRNEMIKYCTPPLFLALLKLFNLILTTGIYPNAWCRGIITPIFKSGSKLDPGNYRGISVTSCLGKVFCSLLNNRIAKHLQTYNPIHKSQIGFQAGSRTSDHLFSLKAIIDTHVKARSRGKVFACFIDFKKAFDSI